jgi:hypothetical protein
MYAHTPPFDTVVSNTGTVEIQEELPLGELNLVDIDPLVPNVSEDFAPRIDYKYSEDRLINELQAYVDKTYGEHYSQNKYQATEFIIDGGHGMGFCLGNILKYTQRYGNKEGYNRKDLMKVLHYALIALHCHDLEND